MSADLKVVHFRPEGYQDPVFALQELIRLIETGEVTSVDIGTVILRCKDGNVETFAFGPKVDDLALVGLLEVGKAVLLESTLYPEPQ